MYDSKESYARESLNAARDLESYLGIMVISSRASVHLSPLWVLDAPGRAVDSHVNALITGELFSRICKLSDEKTLQNYGH